MPIVKTPSGERFYVEKAGEHPIPLILLHGAAASHLDWSVDIRRLAGYRVLAIDLPGHGRSIGTPRHSILSYADSVREVMDELGIEQAYIAGHSMGGAIVQTMAVRMSERVAGLILIATGATLNVHPDILSNAIDNTDYTVALISKWSWGEHVDEDMRLSHIQQMLIAGGQTLYEDYNACDGFDIEGLLPTITQPALIIGGSADKMTPFHLSKTLGEKLPHSTLVQIEGAGHMLPLERPQAIAKIVEDWLNKQR